MDDSKKDGGDKPKSFDDMMAESEKLLDQPPPKAGVTTEEQEHANEEWGDIARQAVELHKTTEERFKAANTRLVRMKHRIEFHASC